MIWLGRCIERWSLRAGVFYRFRAEKSQRVASRIPILNVILPSSSNGDAISTPSRLVMLTNETITCASGSLIISAVNIISVSGMVLKISTATSIAAGMLVVSLFLG